MYRLDTFIIIPYLWSRRESNPRPSLSSISPIYSHVNHTTGSCTISSHFGWTILFQGRPLTRPSLLTQQERMRYEKLHLWFWSVSVLLPKNGCVYIPDEQSRNLVYPIGRPVNFKSPLDGNPRLMIEGRAKPSYLVSLPFLDRPHCVYADNHVTLVMAGFVREFMVRHGCPSVLLTGFEPATCSLGGSCSSIELQEHSKGERIERSALAEILDWTPRPVESNHSTTFYLCKLFLALMTTSGGHKPGILQPYYSGVQRDDSLNSFNDRAAASTPAIPASLS